MDTKNYNVVVIGPSGPEFWPIEKLRGTVGTTPEPVVITTPVVVPPVGTKPTLPPVPIGAKLAGEPRRMVGTKNGNDVAECVINSTSTLIQVTGSNPDAFVPRGYNFDYTPTGPKPTGPSTTNYGNDALPGFTRPDGYRKRYFSDGRIYFEQSDLADEKDPKAVFNEPVLREPIAAPVVPAKPKPTTPAPAGSTLTTYEREPAGQFNPEQFGLNKYFDPNFLFSVDFNADRSLEQRRAVGENLIQITSLDDVQKGLLQSGEAFLYYPEGTLHGDLEGAGYYESSLQEYYTHMYNRVIWAGGQGADKAVKLVMLNIENSNWWSRESYTGKGHFPAWEGAKNKRIQCETDGQWRTLEQIDAQGLMEPEQNVRRGNRLALLFALLRERAADGVEFSYGSSEHQGGPDLDLLGRGQPFLESYPNVSHIGGDAEGNITLQRPNNQGDAHYKLTGSQYDNEDVMTGYYYLHMYNIGAQDARRIWDNPDQYTYADLWAAMETINIVADEKGYIQMCEEVMLRKSGKTHPIVRMWEPVFEGNIATVVDGQAVERYARTPFSEQRSDNARKSGWGDVPKIWQPPYLAHGRYMVTRFRAGAEKGWGTHTFPAGPSSGLSGLDWYDQHLHPYTATYQARCDMQVLESWYAGSELVMDPEVFVDGQWKSLTGPQAYGYHGGVRDASRSSAMLRWKKETNGTTTVAIVAGTKQEYEADSPCRVRFGGNEFAIPLHGPSAHFNLFSVGEGVTGQTFAGQTVTPPPGYAGRTV